MAFRDLQSASSALSECDEKDFGLGRLEGSIWNHAPQLSPLILDQELDRQFVKLRELEAKSRVSRPVLANSQLHEAPGFAIESPKSDSSPDGFLREVARERSLETAWSAEHAGGPSPSAPYCKQGSLLAAKVGLGL
ncbi:slc44a5 [Symbiodinium sp. KB8]|nr:slc44a5 [Symbiodinium sp. KB8]